MTIVKWQPFRGLREWDPYAQIPSLQRGDGSVFLPISEQDWAGGGSHGSRRVGPGGGHL